MTGDSGAGGRDRALDAFRGATVAGMILVNNPGSWQHLYGPLAHAPWHGCTPTDLVFPFFLFAVGASLALVMPALQRLSAGAFTRRVAQRSLLIFGIGLLLNAAPFVRWDEAGALVARDPDTLRIMGVLQRIALCFGVAAVIAWWGGVRAALWAAAALLLGYWAALWAFAQGPDPYSLEGFFGTALDRALLGPSHLYQGEGVPFDPEGLASTLPAVAQVLLGFVVGVRLARRTANPGWWRPLLVTAAVLVAAGLVWSLALPLTKKIWTPSYVLYTTGLAVLTMAALAALLDGRPGVRRDFRGPAGVLVRGCEAFGRNALLVFALSGLVPRLLLLWRLPAEATLPGADAAAAATLTPLQWLYRHGFEPWSADPRLASFLYAVAMVLAYGLLARALDRRGIYFRA
ncbi:MAG: acyltransferase family protein [Gammaproteobacteria bacterium]